MNLPITREQFNWTYINEFNAAHTFKVVEIKCVPMWEGYQLPQQPWKPA